MTNRLYSDVPRKAYLFPTVSCNLQCSMCYSTERAGKDRPGELSAGEYLRIIGELYELGVREFDLSGGEPLLRPDVFDIVSTAAGYPDTSVVIVTNGTLLKARVAREGRDAAGKLDQLDRLYVSLDATTAAGHDSIRGQAGAFHRTLEGLEALRSVSFDRIGINFLLQRDNLHEAGDLLALALDQGARYLNFLRTIDVGASSSAACVVSQGCELESVYTRLAGILEERVRAGFRGDLEVVLAFPGHHLFEHFSYRGKLELPGNITLQVEFDPLRGCPAFANNITITSTGRVTGCTAMVRFPELHIGDVRRDDLHQIIAHWKDHRMAIREREKVVRPLEPCRSCDAWDACRGGCPAVSYKNFGTTLRPDPTCPRQR